MKKGFTLIELLVVVAIIGLLASVVLVSLGNAKNKAADTAVKANLRTVANQAELFASENKDSYLPTPGVAITACPTAQSDSGTDMLSRDKTMFNAITEAINRGNVGSCYNSSTAWAVAVGLKSAANTSWCVDNNGVARQVNSAPADAITSGACNP